MPPELTAVPGTHLRADLAVVSVVVAGLLVFTPGSAHADGALVRATPPIDAVLATSPTDVTLTFSVDVQPELSHVAVFDSSGTEVGDGDYELPEPGVVRLLVDVSADSDYTVAYHVTFLDGMSVTDVYRFSVGTGAVPALLSAATRQARGEAVSGHAHQIDSLSVALLVIDGMVLLVVVALLWLRPRGGRRPMSLRSTDDEVDDGSGAGGHPPAPLPSGIRPVRE